MIKYTFSNIVSLVKVLNSTSIKRIVIYFVLIYPLFFIYINRDDLSMIINRSNKTIVIKDLPNTQERCYKLRQKYNAETVMVYAYQPIGNDKTYKERLIFSTNNYKPLESMRIVNLFSKTHIIESLKKKGYIIIDQTIGLDESTILKAHDLEYAVITKIKNRENNNLIGEVIWIFDKGKFNLSELNNMMIESDFFGYDFDI